MAEIYRDLIQIASSVEEAIHISALISARGKTLDEPIDEEFFGVLVEEGYDIEVFDEGMTADTAGFTVYRAGKEVA